MAIERIDEINYSVEVPGQLPWIGLQKELIEKICRAGHPVADQLIDIIKNMKVGDITRRPEAFYGDVPSVNGVPKK